MGYIAWNTKTIVGLLAMSALGCAAAPPRPAADDPAPQTRTLVVAAVSIEARHSNVPWNLERIETWTRRAAAAGADLVCFHEMSVTGYWQSTQVHAISEPVDGPSIRRLTKLAKETGVVMSVGLSERDGDEYHVAQVLLDGTGVIGVHRKSEVAPGEEKWWAPGADANVFDIRGVHVGVAICYESVHPRVCAALAAGGAEVVLAPYANGTRPDELRTDRRPYTYARAKENRVWYVGCDGSWRDDNDTPVAGAAYIISPEGELVACTPSDAVGENMVMHAITLTGPVREASPSTQPVLTATPTPAGRPAPTAAAMSTK